MFEYVSHFVTSEHTVPQPLDWPYKPQISPCWAEVHHGSCGVLLGWVSTDYGAVSEGGQWYTAVALVGGELKIKWYGHGNQHDAAAWVAGNHVPRAPFAEGSRVLYTNPDSERIEMVVQRVVWGGARLGFSYHCSRVGEDLTILYAGGPCLSSLDGRIEDTYAGHIPIDPVTLAHRRHGLTETQAVDVYHHLRLTLGSHGAEMAWRRASALLASEQ